MRIIDVPDRESLGGRDWLIVEGCPCGRTDECRGVAFVCENADDAALGDLAEALHARRPVIAAHPAPSPFWSATTVATFSGSTGSGRFFSAAITNWSA